MTEQSEKNEAPLPNERVSSVDLAYDKILNQIITGVLQEGEPVKCSSLAKELGFSRTPVSQAIDRLCLAGLLNQELNHRATVAAGAARWFISIHEVRELIEPQAAHAAAKAVSNEAIAELYEMAGAFESATEFEQLRDAAFRFDHALHTVIAEASGNLMAQSILLQCMSYKHFAYQLPNDTSERLVRSHREHIEILRAIEDRDSQTASAAMLFHLRSTLRNLPDPRVV